MSVYTRARGTGSGGAFAAGNRHQLADSNALRIGVDHNSKGRFFRNAFAGALFGGFTVTADGDVDFPFWNPLVIDNTSGELTSFSDPEGAVLVVQFRFRCRVSDGAVTITPKLRHHTAWATITAAGGGTVTTISGAAGCTATAEDYSGTNQYQTIAVTLPSSAPYFKPQFTVSGTGGNPYQIYGDALADCYVVPT